MAELYEEAIFELKESTILIGPHIDGFIPIESGDDVGGIAEGEFALLLGHTVADLTTLDKIPHLGDDRGVRLFRVCEGEESGESTAIGAEAGGMIYVEIKRSVAILIVGEVYDKREDHIAMTDASYLDRNKLTTGDFLARSVIP